MLSACSTVSKPTVKTEYIKYQVPTVIMVECKQWLKYDSVELTDIIVTTRENKKRFDECREQHKFLVNDINNQ